MFGGKIKLKIHPLIYVEFSINLCGRESKRKKSVFVALARRSHCSVKGKHFADDGNTEEYC